MFGKLLCVCAFVVAAGSVGTVSADPLFEPTGPDICLHGSRTGDDKVFIIRWETNEGKEANKRKALSSNFAKGVMGDIYVLEYQKFGQKQKSALQLPNEYAGYYGNSLDDRTFGSGLIVAVITYTQSSVYAFVFPMDLDSEPILTIMNQTLQRDAYSDPPEGWVGCF